MSVDSLSGAGIQGQSARRRAFKAAVALSGKSMYSVATELGVTYNHLVLVLDGKRVGSKRLESGIASVMRAAGLEVASQRST